MDFLGIPLSLTPVLTFLVLLILMDSFKLVSLRSILQTLFVGGLVAMACLVINTSLLDGFHLDPTLFRRYLAPIIEELAKSFYVAYLIRAQKLGFVVDAAIHGFAIGAGFALVENVTYLYMLGHTGILLWLVRGFGTAVMHGSTTAIFATVSKSLAERGDAPRFRIFLPGLLLAVTIHSFFNHFALHPMIMTLLLLTVLPLLVIVIFEQSEKATRNWLGTGFDSDLELLDLVITGDVRESRVGTYLESLRHRFPPSIVGDMLCYLRIHLELAMRAKAQLIAQEAGMTLDVGEDVKANFEELRYLEKAIGVTGKLAMHPFLKINNRDLWQLSMLRK
jgi:RsiW-degrading membrane proteinase PrsW (M82 family)